MKATYIQLTNGQKALIDEEEFAWLSKWKWTCSSGYALCKGVSMHRKIMALPKNIHVDHINGNKLDNRKCNLRPCTNQQNIWNTSVRTSNALGAKGVTKLSNGKYRARIFKSGQYYNLGCFEVIEDAATAYRDAAVKLFGDFARI